MHEQDPAALIQQFTDAWGRQDIETLTSLITDDCVYDASVGPGPGERFVGKEEARRGFLKLLAYDADSNSMPPQMTVCNASRVIVLWEFRKNIGEGKVMPIRGIDVFDLRDGLICYKDAFRKCLA